MAKEREDSLFASRPGGAAEPLASRMRPRSLDEFAGQEHIVGPGRLLRRAIQKDQISSIILSGPPGTGKTTLARVIANCTSGRFVTLNAVLSGVADIRGAIDEAKRHRELYDRRTILFVDEVHRWNKAQQDALLPWVENGTIILVGATTENPFFEVNRALVSRSRVFQLAALGEPDLRKVAEAALSDRERGYGRWSLRFEEGALAHLVSTSEGDARSLLNSLELAVETSAEPWPPPEGSEISVSMRAAEESIQRRAVLYDKDGDYHYDAASAFIKSLRGSDPDAALYWLARMIYAGEDPRFAFRRMLISACEDIGLADPGALSVVLACAQAFERIGMPEGQFHLAHAALYLATAPKSNSALGFFDAFKAVEAESAEVPGHLKDANRDAQGFGHGEGYLYPHAYRDHWVAQQYLPENLNGRIFYQPGSIGLEGERRSSILERREAQVASLFVSQSEGAAPESEAYVWSKSGDARSEWRSRAESSGPARLAAIRSAVFTRAEPSRHATVLVLDAREGYFVWEALRRAKEGTVAALVRDEREKALIEGYAASLPEFDRPLVAVLPAERVTEAALAEALGFSRFDLVLSGSLFSSCPEPTLMLQRLAAALPGAHLVDAEPLPREGGRLSAIIPAKLLGGELSDRFRSFEEGFFAGDGASSLGPGREPLSAALAASGLADLSAEVVATGYQRRFCPSEIEAWLSPESPYGRALSECLGGNSVSRIASAAAETFGKWAQDWPLALLLVQARFPLPAMPGGG